MKALLQVRQGLLHSVQQHICTSEASWSTTRSRPETLDRFGRFKQVALPSTSIAYEAPGLLFLEKKGQASLGKPC